MYCFGSACHQSFCSAMIISFDFGKQIKLTDGRLCYFLRALSFQVNIDVKDVVFLFSHRALH